jgi:hypothetical protein
MRVIVTKSEEVPLAAVDEAYFGVLEHYGLVQPISPRLGSSRLSAVDVRIEGWRCRPCGLQTKLDESQGKMSTVLHFYLPYMLDDSNR